MWVHTAETKPARARKRSAWEVYIVIRLATECAETVML